MINEFFSKVSIFRLVFIATFFFLVGCDSPTSNKTFVPLETFGIKTADYSTILEYVNQEKLLSDVPPPNCEQPIKSDLKILCSRQDFQNIAWIIRILNIYAHENATKQELDHKTSYAEVYVSSCTDENCLGKQLSRDFYLSLDGSGKTDLISTQK